MPASPALSHSNSSFSLRNFVAEEDGFSAAMVKSADICTIALFEVLCSFDKEYAGFVANPPTREFIARTDKRTRAFEGMLVGTLENVSGLFKLLLYPLRLNPSRRLDRAYIPPSPGYSRSPTSPP